MKKKYFSFNIIDKLLSGGGFIYQKIKKNGFKYKNKTNPLLSSRILFNSIQPPYYIQCRKITCH